MYLYYFLLQLLFCGQYKLFVTKQKWWEYNLIDKFASHNIFIMKNSSILLQTINIKTTIKIWIPFYILIIWVYYFSVQIFFALNYNFQNNMIIWSYIMKDYRIQLK